MAPAIDACLVGAWTTAPVTENSPANDEQISYSGGAGEVFTINAQGAVTIDTHAAQKVVFVSEGETFSATVAGTGRGTLKTITAPQTTHGTFVFQPGSDDTRTTTSFDSHGVPLGPPRPDSPFTAVYACTPGQSFTFYKVAVSYMIDGPKIMLIAASAGSASTPSPAASPSASR